MKILNSFESGDQVVILSQIDFTYKPTGKSVSNLETHIWTLVNGKVSKLSHIVDTLQHAAVLK